MMFSIYQEGGSVGWLGNMDGATFPDNILVWLAGLETKGTGVAWLRATSSS